MYKQFVYLLSKTKACVEGKKLFTDTLQRRNIITKILTHYQTGQIYFLKLHFR